MSIFGDGTQTRAFSYIDEVAPIIAESIEVPAAWNNVFNIGADQPYSLNELATRVAHAMGVEPRITNLAARQEVLHAHSSHDKIRHVFGDRPQTSLDDGLKTMAAWVKERGARSSAPFKDIEVRRNLPPAWANA